MAMTMDSLSTGAHITFEVVDIIGKTALDNLADFLEPFHYRILTASQKFKYLGVTKTVPNCLDIHGDELGFNIVPDDNWTIGILTPDLTTRKLILASTAEVQLPTIEATWHPQTIDLLDVGDPLSNDQELLCHGKTHSTIRRGHIGAMRSMVHLEWNPNRLDMVEVATTVYSRIEGHDMGPKFPADVTENHNRVVGYMVEGLSGRDATLADLATCSEALSKLHGLGIVYWSLEPPSFLIADDRVFLHEFSKSYATEDPKVLGVEMDGLEVALKRDWEWPKHLTDDLSHKLLAIRERDGKLHPLLVLYAQKEGRMMEVTEEEHRGMLKTFWVDGDRFKIPAERLQF